MTRISFVSEIRHWCIASRSAVLTPVLAVPEQLNEYFNDLCLFELGFYAVATVFQSYKSLRCLHEETMGL